LLNLFLLSLLFNAALGPFNGGQILMDDFWEQDGSDMDYTSIEALEGHMNRVSSPRLKSALGLI